ncbi:hypothetical protein [Demequina silvatica]|uniref:hypothetical protein n=1 Tax=Demequina silvatica TaxID=1638988 RepID=UPI000785D4BC|nr:hypothetical protein [Demequina silvatica]
MSATTISRYGTEGVAAPAPSDLVDRAGDSLRAVAERFAAASARRRARRAERRASRLPAADAVMQTIGDSFALGAFGRLQ